MKNYIDLKALLVTARKNKEQEVLSILSTLLGEVDLELKRTQKSADEVLIEVATKFKKNTLLRVEQTGESATTGLARLEIKYLDMFLPAELSEGDIRTIVQNMIDVHGKDMKVLMPALKAIKGMNMKVASQIVRES